MTWIPRCAVVLLGSAVLTPAGAQSAPANQPASIAAAAGIEVWSSTDSDKTDVFKLLGRELWSFDSPQKFQGIDVERAWFSPDGQHTREQDRIYLDLAEEIDGKGYWNVKVGTNGHTVLGSASIRSTDWSKEFFIEREIVETPRGLDEGVYYTFAGASMDLLASKQDTLNGVAGLQKFTGRNVRLHLRGTYVHVLDPERGLSIQLRARYFHSTAPGEFDYYSPRNFIQVVPVLQWRRFNHHGWVYVLALGYGAQKATSGSWQGARLADFRVESPSSSKKLHAFAQVQYSTNSLAGGGGNYHYVLARLGFTGRL